MRNRTLLKVELETDDKNIPVEIDSITIKKHEHCFIFKPYTIKIYNDPEFNVKVITPKNSMLIEFSKPGSTDIPITLRVSDKMAEMETDDSIIDEIARLTSENEQLRMDRAGWKEEAEKIAHGSQENAAEIRFVKDENKALQEKLANAEKEIKARGWTWSYPDPHHDKQPISEEWDGKLSCCRCGQLVPEDAIFYEPERPGNVFIRGYCSQKCLDKRDEPTPLKPTSPCDKCGNAGNRRGRMFCNFGGYLDHFKAPKSGCDGMEHFVPKDAMSCIIDRSDTHPYCPKDVAPEPEKPIGKSLHDALNMQKLARTREQSDDAARARTATFKKC